jgi:hypothetical protein
MVNGYEIVGGKVKVAGSYKGDIGPIGKLNLKGLRALMEYRRELLVDNPDINPGMQEYNDLMLAKARSLANDPQCQDAAGTPGGTAAGGVTGPGGGSGPAVIEGTPETKHFAFLTKMTNGLNKADYKEFSEIFSKTMPEFFQSAFVNWADKSKATPEQILAAARTIGKMDDTQRYVAQTYLTMYALGPPPDSPEVAQAVFEGIIAGNKINLGNLEVQRGHILRGEPLE